MGRDTVKIGPDMPEVPALNVSVPTDAPSVQSGALETVRSVDANGNIVETIVSVRNTQVETPAQVEARVQSTYVDGFGNTVVTY